MPPVRFFKITALVALLGAAALTAGCAVKRLQAGAELARKSEPLQASPLNPTHRLLIVGDSTAVGTGASSPQASVPGLIARDHPGWTIVNRAADGARFGDLTIQLSDSDRFDTVRVMCGGNDVIRLTDTERLRAEVLAVARRGHALAPRVILMPAGNVGDAPLFFPPLSWWMSSRARELHAMVREAASATGASYVNLYRDRDDDPFAQQPDRMNAADGLHPSDEGYVFWYEALKQQAGL